MVYTEEVSFGGFWLLRLGSHASSPPAPGVADKGEGGCLESLHGHHDDTPSYGIKHTPRGCVVRAHSHNPADKPQIDGVPQRRLKESVDTGSR